MSSENEPAKLLLPYLQRADELQKHEPLVAYYCRLYAMERGLEIPQKERTKTTNALLVSLMKQLEKDKKSLTLGPDDHLHVEGFALNVFGKADKQDRAGRSDLNTAKTFYAASIFFEILTQFGEVQPDIEQKQKYAVWKAADIRKALKEGRKPIPGPPGGEKDLSRTSSGEYDLEQSRSDFATRPDMNREDPAPGSNPDSDPSLQPYHQDHIPHSPNISPQPPTIKSAPPSIPRYPSEDYPSDNSHQTPDPSLQPYHQDNFQHSTNISLQSPTVTSPPPSNIPRYQTEDYQSDNFHPPPPTNNSDPTIYHHQQPYHHQLEPQHPNFQSYPSQDIPPYSYPNFQSYPSFTESTLPAAPSHPPYYQGSDAPYINSSPSNTSATHPSSAQYNSSGGRNGNVPEASPPITQKYEYDSSYQPSPEKIVEAHKAARFAVGALAFDDVSIGVDYLKKALELLTKPSAGH